jgi:hypothetical protein
VVWKSSKGYAIKSLRIQWPKINSKNLTSATAKLNATKEQIRTRVLGFGWKDLHHPWSKNGVAYTPQQLFDYLVDVILPQERKRETPEKPERNLSSRKDLPPEDG